ncbi:FtsX-like permease family protein [Actinomyces ruminis]|uniref:ABC3 transporter permease C-terminal domain-containing protein n=1 Tax=Actinomyces ruminis TaxID=1937003 RepID=A0ABX4MC60_9ACTO|nr:FtsX-like permease family protein [Actinomyces ruminis]PHP53080.1 hypothetical protein BW737_005000 [Actinomyces ruminis]
MRPGSALLLAVVVAAATAIMVGAFTLVAVDRDGGSVAGGQADALARAGAHALVLGLGGLTGLMLVLIVAEAFSTSLRRRAWVFTLLRETGASASLLVGAVLIQALLIGLLGSAFGLLGAIGAPRLLTAELASALSPTWNSDKALMPQELAVGTALLATLVGSMPPALRAATAPAGTTPVAPSCPRQPSAVRGAIGTLLLVAGAVGSVVVWHADALTHRVGILWTAAGALLVGLLIALPQAVRALVAVLGLPARVGSSGRLALRQVAAAPHAAAAIAVAPMLATAAVCAGAPLAVSLRATMTDDAAPGRAAAQLLDVLPALMICVSALAGLCAAGALAAAAAERTDEGALMRAVGQSRGQRAAQLLCEFALACVAGLVLGAAAGLVLAGAGGAVLADQGIGGFPIPWRQLLLLLAIGCGVGVLSALAPALEPAPRVASTTEPDGAPA